MNQREYTVFLEGFKAAAAGGGLSGSPYGGTDGDLWRRGVGFWLDEHPDQDGDGRPADGTPATDSMKVGK